MSDAPYDQSEVQSGMATPKWIKNVVRWARTAILFSLGVVVALLINAGIQLSSQTAIALWPYVLAALRFGW